MATKALPPTPQTTFAILLGASEWPNYPGFQSSEAFAHAAQQFRAYLHSPTGFALPSENLLNLFDSLKSADEQDETIGQFLEDRVNALKTAGQEARDVLLYFVGHGGFVGSDSDFYLAIRRTRIGNPGISGINIAALAYTLLDKTRHLRHLIILDCCFAAAAFRAFQSDPAQVAITKTIDTFQIRKRATGFPKKGVTLFCSSDHETPSLLLPNDSSTMFTWALLEALSQGNADLQENLSLREVRDLAADILRDLPERNAPRPALHSPDQSQGDIADIPFFPTIIKKENEDHITDEEEPEEHPVFGNGKVSHGQVASTHLSESNTDWMNTEIPIKTVDQAIPNIQKADTKQQSEMTDLPPAAEPPTKMNSSQRSTPVTNSNLIDEPLGSLFLDQDLSTNVPPQQTDISLQHQQIPPVKIIYCYSPKDSKTLAKLETHLSPMYHSGLAESWHMGKLDAGEDWRDRFERQLSTADLVIVLLSADFLNSEFYALSLEALMQSQTTETLVIPILLRPIDIGQTPFAQVQALPANARPISQWKNREAILADIAKTMHKIVQDIRNRSLRSNVKQQIPKDSNANENLAP